MLRILLKGDLKSKATDREVVQWQLFLPPQNIPAPAACHVQMLGYTTFEGEGKTLHTYPASLG